MHGKVINQHNGRSYRYVYPSVQLWCAHFCTSVYIYFSEVARKLIHLVFTTN